MGLMNYDVIMANEEVHKTDVEMERVINHVNEKINNYITIVEDITKKVYLMEAYMII